MVGLIQKTLHKMGQQFPKPSDSFGGDINVKGMYLITQEKQI